MYIHNINPTLFQIGPLEIRYYGLVYVFGFLIAYYFLMKKRKEINLKKKDVENYLLMFMLGLLIGSRLFSLHPAILIQDPLEFFRIWNGGMSFFGGLLGGFLTTYFYSKHKKVKVWRILDLIIFPATITIALGRIANFINGELVGKITTLPWCVTFPAYQGCRHPYQIYAAISHIALLAILFITKSIKTKYKLKDGVIFASFIVFYSILRIITDFWREDPVYFFLTSWQWASIITIFFGILLLYKKAYKTNQQTS